MDLTRDNYLRYSDPAIQVSVSLKEAKQRPCVASSRTLCPELITEGSCTEEHFIGNTQFRSWQPCVQNSPSALRNQSLAYARFPRTWASPRRMPLPYWTYAQLAQLFLKSSTTFWQMYQPCFYFRPTLRVLLQASDDTHLASWAFCRALTCVWILSIYSKKQTS
jgi:hypothetical protein